MTSLKIFLLLGLVAFGISKATTRETIESLLFNKIHREHLTLCSDPQFSDCPDVFIAIYDPKFCALKQDGSWQSYSFACQACQTPDVIGFEEGACVNGRPVSSLDSSEDSSCAAVTCLAGSVCKNGVCLQPENNHHIRLPSRKFLCQGIKCWAGASCVDGVCVPIETPGLSCATIRCQVGTTCQNGRCIANLPILAPTCATILCIQGTNCINGRCVPIKGWCLDDAQCRNSQICLENQCVDSCARIRCAAGTECKNGRCIGLQTQCRKDSQCRKGQICSAGVCTLQVSFEINVCPSDLSPHSCNKFSRPTQSDCPVLYYFRAPDPAICGVTADGTKINFVRSCQACMSKEIEYYFDVPCHEAPFVCSEDQECNGESCQGATCRVDEDCPYDWQFCNQGLCLDTCAFKRCSGCKYGQCAFQQAHGQCRQDADCESESWSCVGFKCVDQCLRIRCPAEQECWKGECHSI